MMTDDSKIQDILSFLDKPEQRDNKVSENYSKSLRNRNQNFNSVHNDCNTNLNQIAQEFNATFRNFNTEINDNLYSSGINRNISETIYNRLNSSSINSNLYSLNNERTNSSDVDLSSYSTTNSSNLNSNFSLNNSQFCPQCKIKLFENIPLKYYQFNYTTSILLCTNKQCNYPFDTPQEQLNISNNNPIESLLLEIESETNENKLNLDYKQFELFDSEHVKPMLESYNRLNLDYEKLQRGEYLSDENTEEEEGAVRNTTLYNIITQKLEEQEMKLENDVQSVEEYVQQSDNKYEQSILSQTEIRDEQKEMLQQFD